MPTELGGGSRWCFELFSRRFKKQNPLRKCLCSKYHLEWLKLDLNTAKIITVQDYKHTKKFLNGSTYMQCSSWESSKQHMRQRYNGNTKRPKLKENQLGISKFYIFCWKISRGPRVQSRGLLGYNLIYENTPVKLWQLYLVI